MEFDAVSDCLHILLFLCCNTSQLLVVKRSLFSINPMPFFVNVTQDEFAEQYEGSPRAYHLQQGIYDMYRKIPNEMEQTGQYTASINDFPTHMSIYTMLVWGLLMNERGYIDYEGAMVAKCGLDGEGGSKICHNFVRFADVWDKEKIGGGNLWVVRIAKYGTLIVEHVDEDVFSEKEEAAKHELDVIMYTKKHLHSIQLAV